MAITKKGNILYYLLPFFFIVSILIFRIGILNPYTNRDADMITHEALINMMLDRSLFKYDETMQFLWRVYPKGFHIMLLPFVLMGIPVLVISKILGLLSALAIPFLFYHLTLTIFSEKRIACLCAFFSYTITPLCDLSFGCRPETVGLLLYLLTLIFFFKYLKSGSLISFFYTVISMLALLYTHPFTLSVLIIPIVTLFTLHLVRCVVIKRPFPFSIKGTLVLGLIIIPAIHLWITNYQYLQVSSRTFIVGNDLFARVSYTDVSFWDILRKVGIFPILFFLLFAVFGISRKTHRYPFQYDIFLVSILMLITIFVIIRFDRLFFLKADRYPPFLATFFYLTGLPTVVSKAFDRGVRNKIILLIIIVSSLLPTAYYIKQRLKRPIVYPYEFFHVVRVFPKPTIAREERIKWFNELLAICDYLRATTTVDTVIACPMWCGDLIRLYSKRSVTSSWWIGGFAPTHRMSGYIYLKHVNNSWRLYNDPDYLYYKYKATYFIFDKSNFKPLNFPSTEVFSTENLKVIKILNEIKADYQSRWDNNHSKGF